MSFLESIARISQPVIKPNGSADKKDPMLGMRRKLMKNIDDQVKKIKSAVEKDRWFGKQSDDSYVLCLRNGNKVLTLNGHTHFAVKDASVAVKLLELVRKAADGGELDEALKETAFNASPNVPRKVRKSPKTTKSIHAKRSPLKVGFFCYQ
jgi:hypothetical protein